MGVFAIRKLLKTVLIAVIIKKVQAFAFSDDLKQMNNTFVVAFGHLKCRMHEWNSSFPRLACDGVELCPKQLIST